MKGKGKSEDESAEVRNSDAAPQVAIDPAIPPYNSTNITNPLAALINRSSGGYAAAPRLSLTHPIGQ